MGKMIGAAAVAALYAAGLANPAIAGPLSHPPQRVTQMGEKATACWWTAHNLVIANYTPDPQYEMFVASPTLGLILGCVRDYHIETSDFLEPEKPPRISPYEKICQMRFKQWNNDQILVSCNTSGAKPLRRSP